MAVILTLGVGLCLFDQDAGHDVMALDLCLVMAAAHSLTPIILTGPLRSGRALAYLGLGFGNVPVRVLDPPPRLARLS